MGTVTTEVTHSSLSFPKRLQIVPGEFFVGFIFVSREFGILLKRLPPHHLPSVETISSCSVCATEKCCSVHVVCVYS